MSADANNPAKELYSLLQRMAAFDSGSKEPTHKILRQFFGTGKSDTELLEVIAIVLRRFDRLKELLPLAPDLDAEHKGNAARAIDHLKQMFAPDHLVANWEQNIAMIARNGNLQIIQFLSPAVGRIVCYKVPTPHERKVIIGKIDRAITSLDDGSDIRIEALFGSMRTLRTILEKLDFFGVEELAKNLGLATAKFQEAQSSTIGKIKSETWWKRLRIIGGILFGIATAITVFHDLPGDVADIYQETAVITQWVREQTEQFLPELPQPRLLAPPEEGGDGNSGQEEDDPDKPLLA